MPRGSTPLEEARKALREARAKFHKASQNGNKPLIEKTLKEANEAQTKFLEEVKKFKETVAKMEQE